MDPGPIGRGEPSRTGHDLPAKLVRRSDELTRRWYRRLRERRQVRPARGTRGDEVLERIPEVVEKIVGAGVGELSPAVLERLGAIARGRKGPFFDPGMLFAQMASLEDVLVEALAEDFGSRDTPPGWKSVLEAVRAISRNVHVASASMALVFFEEIEEERRSRRDEVSEFTRVLNHELRDPLGTALAAARVLNDVGDDISGMARHEMLDAIPRNIDRAVHLLESIRSLKMSHTAPGKPTRTRSLRDLMRDLVEGLGDSMRGSKVSVEVAQPLPECEVDDDRVSLILHNLVLNAVKYSDPAKEPRWVKIRIDPAGHSVEDEDAAEPGVDVLVEDNGIGIEAKDLEHIFRSFYRGRSHGVEGSGLGLAIARQAAQQLGSDIVVRSEPGNGSAFSFFAPCFAGRAERAERAERAKRAERNETG